MQWSRVLMDVADGSMFLYVGGERYIYIDVYISVSDICMRRGGTRVEGDVLESWIFIE